MNELGDYLKKMREAAEITQEDLARSIGCKTKQYVSNVERGKCNPALKYVRKWCERINASKQKTMTLLVDQRRDAVKKAIKI